MATTNVTETGDDNIDGLLSKARWISTSVSFSFTDSIDDYESGYPNRQSHANSFESLNKTQKDVTHAWSREYSNVSLLNLSEETGANDRNATIRIAESDDPDTAYAEYPSSSSKAGDIWFNRTEVVDDPKTPDKEKYQPEYNNPAIGNYAYHTFGHELGHALGLKHGHETTDGVRDITMEEDRNSMEFSIMTYKSYIGHDLKKDEGYQNGEWGYAQSLMMYDIRAIQEMYGARFDDKPRNTTYTFSDTTGEMSMEHDGQGKVGQGKPGENFIFRTIWDGGGIDTYDFSNYETKLSINLAPGGWSDLDVGGNSQRAFLGMKDGVDQRARGHVFNALQYKDDPRSLIENANGGSNNDTIVGNIASNVLHGNNGDDTLKGEGGNDFLHGGDGHDTLAGGTDHDELYGGIGLDTINGGDGNDYADGWEGDDTLYGGTTSDRAETGTGNDTLVAWKGEDCLYGQDGDDWLDGSYDNDILYGGEGHDTLGNSVAPEDGDDEMYGESGNDGLYGGAGKDALHGGLDSDYLNGGGGNLDRMSGGEGDDQIIDEDGVNGAHGNEGNDTIAVTFASDWVNTNGKQRSDGKITGGYGDDTITVTMNHKDFFINMKGDNPVNPISNYSQDGNDTITLQGSYANSVVDLGGGNDTFNGGKGGDNVSGSGGSDTLIGGDGNDKLAGHDGDDILIGGSGNDTLTSGPGFDIFRFDNISEKADKITDFTPYYDDIQVVKSGFGSSLNLGTITSDLFRLGSSAGDPSDRFIYNQSTGALFFDQDGTGSAGQVQFATLSNKASLSYTDIVVIA